MCAIKDGDGVDQHGEDGLENDIEEYEYENGIDDSTTINITEV